nr:hypothetical protein [Tanacetum cinerariifolium]
MNDKMNDPECVTHKVKIAPHNYPKDNLLATFTPQKQLTPEQIFWSNDLVKIKSEALKEWTKVSRPIKAFTVLEEAIQVAVAFPNWNPPYVWQYLIINKMAYVNAPSDQTPTMAPPRKHRFHQRPNSPLHLSNEEPVLGYLKFSAKGTKREIFGMPIPSKLITANIREAPYYQEYQENVAKHIRFLAGETKGTQDLPAPKPAKPARKPQSTAQKAPLKHSISSPPRSSPKFVGKSEAEEVPAEELQVADEDADFQKAVEERMKDAYALPKGPLHQWSSGNLRSDTGAQAKGQAGSNPDETSEGQAGSNPDETSEGQAGPDPANAEARIQSTSNTVVHVGSDREHMDLDVANVSPQPSTEQLYEGFTTTVYPKVQENLKLAVEEPVLLEEPASSSGTLSSLQHLSRDFSFGDQFFSDKPSDADKSAETKVESMQLKATTTDTTTTTTTTLPPPQAPQHSTTEVMMVKRIGELEHTLADLIQSHEDHMQLFEALEKSINHDNSEELVHDLAEARKKKKKGRESPKTPHGSPSHQPPPPPPPAGPSRTLGAPRASGSQVTPPPPPPTSTNQD